MGDSAAGIYLHAQPCSLVQLIRFSVCGFALFRAGSFVHEIAQLRSGEMTGFCVGWNLLCGIPSRLTLLYSLAMFTMLLK